MLISFVMTYIMHVYDMFDEIIVMANRGPVKYFVKYLHFYHGFNGIFHF